MAQLRTVASADHALELAERRARIDALERELAVQVQWIEECGGSLAGYIRRYGDSAAAPGRPELGGRYGNGAQLIYEADLGALRSLEQRLAEARAELKKAERGR